MPKKLRQEYAQFKRPYTRPPIHHKSEKEDEIAGENEEDEEIAGEDEEEKENYVSENYSNIHKRKTNLYPDLKDDLRKLHRTTKSNDSREDKKTKPVMFENLHSAIPFFKSGYSILGYSITFLILIVCVIGFFFSYIPKKPSDKVNVSELVDNMKIHFREQESINFKVLKKALMKIVEDQPEPRAPAIFTVVANKGAEKSASEFSMHLAKALAPDNYVLIDDSLLYYSNPDEQKLIIENEIKSKLENETLNVVIVDRLNNIPIDAAMIFHGFCDGDDAQYKRAVYLFIVHLGRSISRNLSIKDRDRIAMDSLRNIWKTSSDDLVDSLISRISVNVVSIT